MLDVIGRTADSTIVINTKAANQVGLRKFGGMLTQALRQQERDLVVFWVIDRKRDGLELLGSFLETLDSDERMSVHVVRNLYWGEEGKFDMYNGSELKKEIERRGGRTLNFPDVADRLAEAIKGGAVRGYRDERREERRSAPGVEALQAIHDPCVPGSLAALTVLGSDRFRPSSVTSQEVPCAPAVKSFAACMLLLAAACAPIGATGTPPLGPEARYRELALTVQGEARRDGAASASDARRSARGGRRKGTVARAAWGRDAFGAPRHAGSERPFQAAPLPSFSCRSTRSRPSTVTG
jgi:hypothetical protein